MSSGPGFQALITPSVFAAELERVRTLIDDTARDVATAAGAGIVSPAARQGWTAFLMRWGAFYVDHRNPGWLTVALNGPFNLIFGFEREALAWRGQFRAGGVALVGPDPLPSTPFGPLMPAVQTIGTTLFWGGALLLGAVILTNRR